MRGCAGKFDGHTILHILHVMQRNVSRIALLLVLLLPACDLINGGAIMQTAATTTPEAATPTATSAQVTADPVVPAPVITETSRTLTIWMPPEIALRNEAGAAILNDQLLAFAAAHPDLDVKLEYKSASGQGSVLNYLRTGRNVAPDVLPDLIAIPTDQLAIAASEELVYPLNDLIDPALVDDLYPAAQALVHSGEQIIGYPFALTSLPHLAYDRNTITTTIPLNWNELIADSNNRFIFPAAGREGAILALEFYLAAGGTLVDDAGQATLQLEPFVTALEQLSQGRNTGFILLQSSNMSTLEETWQAFEAGSASLVETTSSQFLQENPDESAVAVAPVSGLNGPLTPLVNGWAWAISTPESTQRALAAELLSELASSANLGDWSHQSYVLPARREAFMAWPPDEPYTGFVQQELERAQPNPISGNSNIMTTVGDAVFDVVSLAKSPQVAAEEAVAAIQQ